MTHGQSGVPGARTFASATTQQQGPDDRRPRRRPTLGGVLRWSATGALCVGALVLFAAAGSISETHEADLRERGEGIADARDRIMAAEIGVETVPAEAVAKGWLLAATTVGETITKVQNTFAVNTGPLDLTDIPVEVMTPIGLIQVYTEDERIAMAEEVRASKINGLDRQLLPLFTPESTDPTGMNAASNWALGLSSFEDDATLAGYTWSSPAVGWFDQSGHSRVVWELRTPDGDLTAWAVATFDHKAVKFTDLAVHKSTQEEVA